MFKKLFMFSYCRLKKKRYKPFAILLKDTVGSFRIYVYQSGNKGMSISQTDKTEIQRASVNK